MRHSHNIYNDKVVVQVSLLRFPSCSRSRPKLSDSLETSKIPIPSRLQKPGKLENF